MARYVLEAREREVLERLRRGETLTGIAAHHRVAMPTLRVIVATLRMKYGADSIKRLVELVASGAQTVDMPSPQPELDRAQRKDQYRDAMLSQLEQLGPERDHVPCRNVGCPRGAIEYSVMCRRHHVEMLFGTSMAGYGAA